MSPRRPVQTLYHQTLRVMANNVASAISLIHAEGNLDELDTYEVYDEELHSISTYLISLPPNISQELMQSILSTEDLLPAIRFCALKLFFHNHIRTLIVGTFPQDYYLRVLDIVENNGSDLQILDLRGIWVKGDETKKLEDMLHNLPNLKELYIPHIASDSILAALGRSNNSLLVLDVSGDCNISEEGIETLCCGPSFTAQRSRLQIVNIGNPGEEDVTSSAIILLLQNLPDLMSLGGYSFVGKALLKLMSEDENNIHQTNLHYLHDTGTDGQIFDAIMKLCPKLESIYLDSPTSGIIGRLHLLPKLNELKISRFDSDELNNFFTNGSNNLKTLELILGKGVLNMSVIASSCLNLEKLVCYKMDFLTHYDQAMFTHLKTLEIIHSIISTSCVRYLLSSSPVIQELSIGENIDLTDDNFADILNKNVLSELSELWLTSARNLSRITVEVLMITCPNLRSIGVLSGWGIAPDDVQELLYEIQISNLDLMLLEFFED